MPPNRSIPLSDGFPPIRERNSSPVPPVHSTTARPHCRSSAAQKRPSQRSCSKSSPPRLQRKGLGSKDIHNEMTKRRSKDDSPVSSPLKRGSEYLDVDDVRRLKKHHLTSVYDDDMDWIKREITEIKNETREIKSWMIELQEYLQEEVNFRIGDVLYQLEQMNSN